ncbi:hypothetical protein PFISCL1PPCAC_12228, partial [Pristionchus fissidentatus]
KRLKIGTYIPPKENKQSKELAVEIKKEKKKVEFVKNGKPVNATSLDADEKKEIVPEGKSGGKGKNNFEKLMKEIPPIIEIPRDDWPSFYIEEIDRVINRSYEIEKLSDERQANLDEVQTKLRQAIQMKVPQGFRLDAFGSSVNGFGSIRSDFDVCFRYIDNEEKDKVTTKRMIKSISRALHRAGFGNVMPIANAKVPIVKFSMKTNSGEEIEGDISYYNDRALHNTRLLSRYCSWTKDNLLSKLGMFIKKWAKQCEIGDASMGSLSSYAYIILLIHFLQQLQPAPLLPVLQEMGDKEEIMKDGWDVYFCDEEPTPNWSSCNLSVGELFIQFLDYYAKYDWQNEVVQIRQMGPLTKADKKWTSKKMCIEDPFVLDHNLGGRVGNQMFVTILKSFVITREIFFTLSERDLFLENFGGDKDYVIAEENNVGYGIALLSRCRSTLGVVPRVPIRQRNINPRPSRNSVPAQNTGVEHQKTASRKTDAITGGGGGGKSGGVNNKGGRGGGPPNERKQEQITGVEHQ